MEFPIYTPWENLDAQTIQKVINSGINYRTYCDEKPWDVSFEIDFLPKEELIIVVLIEHGRRKGGVSVQKTSERTEISPYSKEEQAEMLKAYNEKIDRYETWNALFTGPTTGLFGNNVYESYMDYMYSWEHWSDRIFLSDYYEEQLYSVQSDTYVTVKSTQEGYDCIYELAQVKVKEHILEGICWKSFPKLIFSRGDKSDAPYKDVYNRLEILTGAEYLIVPALIEIKEKYKITAVSEKLDCPQMRFRGMTMEETVKQAVFENIFGEFLQGSRFCGENINKKCLIAEKQKEIFASEFLESQKYPELLMNAVKKADFHCMAFKVLGILNSPYMQTYDKIEMLRSCMAISNSAEKSREWKNAYQNLIWVMIKKLEMDDSQGNNLEVVSELQKFVEYQQGDFEKEQKGKSREETAEIFLMNELIRMLACISIVTVKKIQGQECAELAEKSWFMAESIEYMWNAEILNQQVRENVQKTFIRICVGCGSMYLQNVQEKNVNPEQIIETAEKVLLLLNNHRDLILQEEMPVYQIPIYQMLQVANIRLNHDENALYYARKGVELCDGINADNNAQLNGMIRDSKRMFQEYINQNAQKVPEKAKKKGFFSRLFSR